MIEIYGTGISLRVNTPLLIFIKIFVTGLIIYIQGENFRGDIQAQHNVTDFRKQPLLPGLFQVPGLYKIKGLEDGLR